MNVLAFEFGGETDAPFIFGLRLGKRSAKRGFGIQHFAQFVGGLRQRGLQCFSRGKLKEESFAFGRRAENAAASNT